MKEDILKYGISYGSRYYSFEKRRFLKELAAETSPLSLEVQLLKSSRGLAKTTHLLVNDPAKAEVLFVVGYDTLTKLVPSTPYYPFNPKKNTSLELKHLALQALLFSLGVTVDYLLLQGFPDFSVLVKTVCIGVFLLSAIFYCSLLFGIPNRLNYNRNSISIVLVLNLIRSLGKNPKFAFVFLDRASGSYQGYRELERYLTERNCSPKYTIIPDAIADGDLLVFAGTRQQEKVIRDLTSAMDTFPTYVKLFDKPSANPLLGLLGGMIICGGSQIGSDLVVKRSRSKRDYGVNLERLKKLTSVLINTFSS